MIATTGMMASCQSATLQSSNIANETCGGQPCAVPISDNATIASGEFILDDSKLDGIRTAVDQFSPEIIIHVDRNGTPAGCTQPGPGQIPDEACLQVSYVGGVSIDPTYVSIPVLSDQSNVPSGFFNANTVPLVNGQVDGTTFDLLAIISGRDAYELRFKLDPTPGAITAAPPSALYFQGSAEFPIDNQAGTFLCNCVDPALSNPLPDGLCDVVCQQLASNYLTSDCEGTFIQIKLNRFDFGFGFIPQLPSTQSGNWTKAFGGANFHLAEMFDTSFIAQANADVISKDWQSIASITAGDIVVGAELIGCPPTDYCSNHTCDADVAAGIAAEIAPIFKDRVSAAITTLLTPLFNYNKPNAPPGCIVGDPIFGCSTAQLTDWAAASFTFQKWSWLAGAFGSYPNGGWLPIKSIDTIGGPFGSIRFGFDNDIDGDALCANMR